MAPSANAFIAAAQALRGVPYVWGGTSRSGVDCSGLVQLAAREVGINVPRTSEDQWNFVQKVSADQVQPGDLVFFTGADPPSPGHVGIVIAPGTAQHGPEMIDAPYTGTVVQDQGFDPSGSGVNRVVGYGRIPGLSYSGVVAAAAGSSSSAGGLLSWPSEITGFFSDADSTLGQLSAVALALFQPSTYIRAAAGGLALIFLIAGLIFLVKASA